ncbi:MAG: Ig-like domain-containing protein [Pseudomonadota bacterium]
MKINNTIIIISGAFMAVAFSPLAAQQHETTYSYDKLGRLKQTDYDTSKSQKYKYDAAGNRRQVSSGVYDPLPNEAPVVVLDSKSMNEDDSLTIKPLQNDSDPEGDPITLATVGSASNGVATKSGNNVLYSPNTNWSGSDSFSYTVSDGTSSVSGTIDVTVAPVNDAPVANNTSQTITEDVTKTFGVRWNDSDVDTPMGSVLITQVTQGAKGSVSITSDDERVIYNPATNQNGSDSFTYTISDGELSDTASVSISITPVNDAPVAVADVYTGIDKSQWTVLNVRGGDYDIDSPNFTVSSASGGFGQKQIINNNTQVRYRCPSCSGTEDGFNYTITDGSLTSGAGVVVFFSSGGGGGVPLF